MANLKLYRYADVEKSISRRPGETKLGERLKFLSSEEELSSNKAKFVLFGIPEDIGPRANHGKPGTAKAWKACLHALLNVQHNQFNNGEDLLLLGEISCKAEMEKAALLELTDPNYFVKLGELVEKIDQEVSSTMKKVISAGKIPIIIGGGHNNAYGNLKGTSEALGAAVNALNIDAHTDLRLLEHRHSGNGFSYARDKGFLKKYVVFGLHKNYTPQSIFDEMQASDNLQFILLEDLQGTDKALAFDQALQFVGNNKFGLEVDCDSMASFPSSALSPSGFSLNEVRNFVRTAAKSKNCAYLHLCEAAVDSHFPTGKALSYLVTDFVGFS